jgi:UDP-3-O-[3-hydroxymyristoyl] glucosamine N-acyltransferase
MKLSELAEKLGAELVGDGAIDVTRVSTLDAAQPGDLSFLSNARYAKQLGTTSASAVIVGQADKSDRVALLRCKDPYFAFRQAVVALHGFRKHPFDGIHPDAYVDPSATIGARTIIYPGAFVGPRVTIGDDCIIYPNAVIYDDCRIGDRVIIHSGAAIGPDGYGFAFHKGVHNKIPQVGHVVIGDDVEIGSNAVIARGAIGATTVAEGTKIDALVMLGHGVQIGPHSLLVAQTGIAGSTTLGHHVTIAGQVGIAGHLKIGNAVTIAAKSGIMADIEDGETVMGSPAMPAKIARRVLLHMTQLPELVDRLRKLEKRLDQLDADPGDAPTTP